MMMMMMMMMMMRLGEGKWGQIRVIAYAGSRNGEVPHNLPCARKSQGSPGSAWRGGKEESSKPCN
jgi:hypothetical protein